MMANVTCTTSLNTSDLLRAKQYERNVPKPLNTSNQSASYHKKPSGYVFHPAPRWQRGVTLSMLRTCGWRRVCPGGKCPRAFGQLTVCQRVPGGLCCHQRSENTLTIGREQAALGRRARLFLGSIRACWLLCVPIDGTCRGTQRQRMVPRPTPVGARRSMCADLGHCGCSGCSKRFLPAFLAGRTGGPGCTPGPTRR